MPPSFSLSVADTRHLLTFAIMLGVALTISNITAGMRYQARVAMYRERRTRALNELGRELAGALVSEQILESARTHLEGLFRAKVCLLLPDEQDKVSPAAPVPGHLELPLDPAIAQWVYDHQQAAGLGTGSLPGAPMHYLPLKAPMRTRGVLALLPAEKRLLFQPEQARLLETFATQIALALERLLCNLLENAAKYTPPGSLITIRARHHDGRVTIAVEDEGPGLPPGREESLFEKFTRGRAESALPGVGLGLAIVRAIVQAHEGRVRAENRPEGGARFLIELPAGEPPPVPAEAG